MTQPDAVTVTIDSREVHVSLGAIDSDPEGDPVVFAGTDGNLPPGVRIVDATTDAGPDTVVLASSFPGPGDTSGATPGSYQVRTYVTDGTGLSARTLTITVLPSPGDAVQITRKRRPGRVVVSNDNDTAVRLVWGAEGRRRADGSVDVPAHGARTVTVLRKSVVTVVLAGTDYAVGVRRHLKAPRDGTALPPGVEPGHGPFQAILTRWVKRTIGA